MCDGRVFHQRVSPTVHDFSYPVSYVWVDPDAPGDVCNHHPLWSATRAAPARFRSLDYGDGSTVSLGDQVRDELQRIMGRRPDGPLRMLTQVRRWGWLFNPITLYVAWDMEGVAPIGAVLEVTNTPWKERHRYAVELVAAHAVDGGSPRFTARAPKVLHVSPFLDEQFDYVIALSADDDDSLGLTIDVVRPDTDDAVVRTGLQLQRRSASRSSLAAALRRNPVATHRVSAGIHAQAARLWIKGVPVMTHPRKRKVHR